MPPVEVTERFFDPNDPNDPLGRLVAGRSGAVDSADVPEPWVTPDYASIPGDADVPLDEDERTLVWPGPAMIMPAGLLPDGRPYEHDDRINASRICGERVTNSAEADATVRAFDRQQDALRRRAGLALARYGESHELEDLPATLEAIKQLHLAEWDRRRRAAGG